MSDPNTQNADTNANTSTETPDIKAVVAERDSLAARVKELEGKVGSVKELEGKLAAAIVERDGFSAKVKDFEAIKAKHDELVTTVDGFRKKERESAIVNLMQAAAPGADGFALSAALVKLAEAGEVDRYSEKPQEAAAKAIELIKARSPQLLTAPALGGGGAHGKQPPVPPKRKSLIS